MIAISFTVECSFGEEPPAELELKETKLFQDAYVAIRDYLIDDEILISPEILNKAELGDHFETINPERQDKQSALGTPDSRIFSSVRGNEGVEEEGGTFGKRDGGGRRLMVPYKSVDLHNVIMKCMNEDITKTAKLPTSDDQLQDIQRQISSLGSDEFKEREAASKALIKIGVPAVFYLAEIHKSTKDLEVQTRTRALIHKIKLRSVIDKFRVDNKEKKTKEK